MEIREDVNQNERLYNFTLIAKEQQLYSCSTFQSKFGSYNKVVSEYVFALKIGQSETEIDCVGSIWNGDLL